MNCPCCLQAVPPEAWWVGTPFSPSEARLLANLEAVRPNPLSAEQLLKGVYIDRGSLAPLLSRIRPKIAPFGWTIPSNLGGIGRVGIYRLQEVA